MSETTVEATTSEATEAHEGMPTAAQAKATLARGKAAAAKAEAKAKAEAEAAATAAQEEARGEEQKLKNMLRNQAEREVLDNHRDEYVTIATAKFTQHGLVFQRRKTEAEKAADQIAKLLAAHPELAAQFNQVDPSLPQSIPEDEPQEMPTPDEVPEFIEGTYGQPGMYGQP